MWAEIDYIWILRALQVYHPDSWAYIRVPHLYSVCVCVRIHTHTPTGTYTPTRAKNTKDRDNTPIFPSVKKQPPKPSNKYFHRLAEPPHPHSPMLNETNCTYTRTYAHPVASVKQMCPLMFTTSVECTHLHMHDVHNTCECMHTLRKNAYGLGHTRLCNGAEASLP